jgi:prenyltransferase beta subunit
MPNSCCYHMQSYDGGFGMVPGSESHGKKFHLTFSCVALPASFVSDICKLSFDYVATQFNICLLHWIGFSVLIVCLCVSE